MTKVMKIREIPKENTIKLRSVMKEALYYMISFLLKSEGWTMI